MDKIMLNPHMQFSDTAEELKDKFEEVVEAYQSPMSYANTQASLFWIIHGSIEYFDQLDEDFLGEGNECGIPNMKADHFANNINRLLKSIDYLSRLWKLNIEKSDELKLLLDIRTLIVHSGEQLTKIESLKLKGYKDSQLGRIFSSKKHRAFIFTEEHKDMDYCIEVWNDKHDKTKKDNLIKVDHHITNQSYVDISIYLKYSDVRDIMLSYIKKFVDSANDSKPKKKIKKFPKIKNKFINMESETIHFDKIANLLLKGNKGDYVVENEVAHWNGFGLKRLYEYSKEHLDTDDKNREIINEKIHTAMSKYWDDYQDENLSVDEFDFYCLDIRTVFKKFTPKFKLKGYLEDEKLFNHIAPFFNTNNNIDKKTDEDYLNMFVNAASNALGKELVMRDSVEDLVCDYFVQSIQVKKDSSDIE